MEKKKIQVAWVFGNYRSRRATMQIIRKKFESCGLFVCDGETSFEYKELSE